MATTLEKILIGTGAATLVAGVVVVGSIIGAAFGALGGEILDHTPYLNRAIPEGIGFLSSYINPDATTNARVALQGNLDKVGATMGFIGGFYRASLSCKKD